MTLLLLQMSIVLLVAVACGRLARTARAASRHRGDHRRHPDRPVGLRALRPASFGRPLSLNPPSRNSNSSPPSALSCFSSSSAWNSTTPSSTASARPPWPPAAQASSCPSSWPRCSRIPCASASPRTASATFPFVLFLGIAMSITAFPVLARILEERNLQSTPLGTDRHPQRGRQRRDRMAPARPRPRA